MCGGPTIVNSKHVLGFRICNSCIGARTKHILTWTAAGFQAREDTWMHCLRAGAPKDLIANILSAKGVLAKICKNVLEEEGERE